MTWFIPALRPFAQKKKRQLCGTVRKWGEVFIPTNQLPYLRLQIITRICACEIPPPDLEKPVAFAQALMSEAVGKVLRFWRENGIYSNLKPYELILWALENDNPPPRKPKYKKKLGLHFGFQGGSFRMHGCLTNLGEDKSAQPKTWINASPKNGGIFPWWSTSWVRIRKKNIIQQNKEKKICWGNVW